jgi:hypothetical protein
MVPLRDLPPGAIIRAGRPMPAERNALHGDPT